MKITDQKNVQSYGISQTDGQEANSDIAKPSSTGLGELRDRFETSGKKALDELLGPNDQLLGPNNRPITGARQFEIQNQADLKPNPVDSDDSNLRKKVDQPDPPQTLGFQDAGRLLSLSPDQFLINEDGVVILKE